MSLPTSEAGARNYEYARRQQAAADARERLANLPTTTVVSDPTTATLHPVAGKTATHSPGHEKEHTMNDQTIFTERVTAIRTHNPSLSLIEAQRLARVHATEEGWFAPGIGDGIESIAINDTDESPRNPLLGERDFTDEELQTIEAQHDLRLARSKGERVRAPYAEEFAQDITRARATGRGDASVRSVEDRLKDALSQATDADRKADLAMALATIDSKAPSTWGLTEGVTSEDAE